MQDRLAYIDRLIQVLDAPFFTPIQDEIETEINLLTIKLIGENNDETRGAIKALRKLTELRTELIYERNYIQDTLKGEQ
jgi:hypothetical protein